MAEAERSSGISRDRSLPPLPPLSIDPSLRLLSTTTIPRTTTPSTADQRQKTPRTVRTLPAPVSTLSTSIPNLKALLASADLPSLLLPVNKTDPHQTLPSPPLSIPPQPQTTPNDSSTSPILPTAGTAAAGWGSRPTAGTVDASKGQQEKQKQDGDAAPSAVSPNHMSDPQQHHPQHTQSQSLSTSYTPAPLRLPVTYAPQGPYPQAVFGIHHPHHPSATFPPVSSSHYVESYRGAASMPTSPQGPLPSVRMLNLQGQPTTTASHYGMAMTSPMSPPIGISQTMGFFSVPVPQIGYNAYMSPQMAPMFSRPSNKKEIKRRTKTGCLTCRKRRIKCDEGRPLCNNCRKSKRECQGYDHVVKTNGPPAAIQPAPSQSTSTEQTPLVSPSSASATSPDTIHSPFGTHPQAPGGFGSAITSPHIGHEPSYTASSSPALVTPPIKPDHFKSEPLDYTSVDPALHTPPATSRPVLSSVPRLSQPTPAASQQSQLGHGPAEQRPALSINVTGVPHRPTSPAPPASDYLFFAMMKVNEIISGMGASPAPRSVQVTEDTFRQVVSVYHEIYAPGLVNFFEVPWFVFKDRGQDTFPRDTSLLERFAAGLEAFQAVSVTNHAAMGIASVVETQLIWSLATMVHTVHQSLLPTDSTVVEARSRVFIVSTLLSGDYLTGDASTRPQPHSDPRRASEFEFWLSLWEFLTCKDSTPETVARRTEALGKMRATLDGRENRDILHALAVIRALAPHYPPGIERELPQHRDESDSRNQLGVAIEFLQNEAKVSGGVTNVSRRMAEIGLRALVNPGMCITRTASIS